MGESLELPADLMRRYRRCIRFDYWLCALYVLSAAIPAWQFFSKDFARAFHATGAFLIVCVGVAGMLLNGGILRQRITRQWPVYSVTIAFILSRIGLSVWGAFLIFDQIMREFSIATADSPWAHWFKFALQPFVSTPLVYLFFFAAVYRTIYHISVHFYLRGMTSVVRP